MQNFKLTYGEKTVPINQSTFPGGESYIQLGFDEFPNIFPDQVFHLVFHFTEAADMFKLAFIVDALRRRMFFKPIIHLYMPYLPYARQDRVCNQGESFSLKVVCDFINSLKLERVVCTDIHSDVGVALLDNLIHATIHSAATRFSRIFTSKKTVLVSPDAGSNKKVFDLAKRFRYDNVVRADKVRDVATGQIKETVVYSEHIGDRDFLIVDDICDGGRTFLELAKVLRPLTNGKIFLYVSHAILSKGLEPFDGVIDGIWTSNLMNSNVQTRYQSPTSILTVLE